MILLYLTIYLLLSISIVIASLRCKAGYLRYPFWAALTFGGFALPQFVSLLNSKAYPGYSLEKYVLMAILCLAATYFGFKSGSRAIPVPRLEGFFSRKMDAGRLRWLALLYILIGGLCMACLYSSGAQFANQQWEGPWTIYLFFSWFMVYGFIIAADLHLQAEHKAVDAALALLGGMYLLLRAAVHGRRSNAVILFITILGLLWFRRRKIVPVSLIIAVVAFGFVVSASAHAYRIAVADRLEFSELKDIDFVGTFVKSFGQGQASEVLNGCYVIETIDRTMAFDFGASHWNAAVWSFVPRQFVGKEFKQSLMIPFDVEEDIYRVFGYAKNTGTTITGIADSYLSFSYAGCIKFFLIAFVLGVLYANSERGSTIAIILYLLLLPQGLMSFTHGTMEFTDSLIMYGALLLPALLLYSISDTSMVQMEPNSGIGIVGWNWP